ncbi:MAG: hypothetical protein LC664_06865, partial [Flavobacteriales bacterium]|nr:hypothetical protein [Flavobacteriales bacterium]
GNYTINQTAMLWVNGGSAAKGAPEVIGGNNSEAIVPYGIIKVSAGALYANCTSGITTRANGLIQLDDGYIFANQIRTSVQGTENIGGVIINGGSMEVDGTAPGGTTGTYYTFSLTYPGNIFRMTGGELRVKGPTGRGLIFINSDPEQTNVSGGKVIAEVINTSNNHKITSRAPFWNLEIERSNTSGTNRAVRVDGGSSGSGGEQASISDQALFVRNKLTISGTNSATLDMNNLDLYLDGDLTIEDGGVYDHGLNTTYFDGNNNSFLSLPSNTVTFNNVVVDKDADTRFAEIQTGNTTRAMEVQGTFSIERGYLEYNDKNISLLGDVIIKSNLGSPSSTGIAFMEGASAQEISSSNGVFYNLDVDNAAGIDLTTGDLLVRKRMKIANGVFNLSSHKLRVEAPDGFLDIPSPNATNCFATNGQSSAGGLEVAFKSATQETTFPVGVKRSAGVDYTPAVIRANSGFVDTGYVRVAPVDTVLLTTDITAAPHYLNYYWKVNYSAFDNLPNVSHRFEYLQADVVGNEDSLASGRVLFESPFLRSVDSTAVFDDNVNIGSNYVYYNGPNEETTLTGVGDSLVNADYTAAHRDRFVGGPDVYYSISSSIGADWNDSNHWTDKNACTTCVDALDFHSSGSPSSNYPRAGDIAFIGFIPATGQPHVYTSAGGVEVSQLNFTQMQDGSGNPLPRYFQAGATNLTLLRPTLIANSTNNIEKIGEINGEGALKLTGDVNLSEVNAGGFLAQDESIVIIESGTSTLDFLSFPPNIPNLFITSNNNGSNNNSTKIINDVTIRGDLEIVGAANLIVNAGATGDISVGNDLILAKYQAPVSVSGAELLFDNVGSPRTVDVRGNIIVKDNGSSIRVESPNSTPQVVHNLVAWKDITQDASGTTGLNLFTSLSEDFIELTLRGEGSNSFTNHAGNTPQLGRLIVDKGVDLNASFTFNSDVDIDGPSNQVVKSVELLNGLLELNDPGIDVTLSSGGGDFKIPSTAGLELTNGTLRINGNETGMLLDGLLKISGGVFNLGDTPGQNNYLEYSSTGTAQLEIHDGVFNVGSQIRRGLTNVSGVLKYIQTGGEVNLGIYSAPSANRAVLEILNTGSLFEHTGGVINFYRGINSSSIASFILEDLDNFTVGPGSSIVIGHANSPSGGAIQNFGIQSSIALNALEINNDSGHDPIVRLQVFDLELNDLLEIDEGSQLNCANRNLILNSDITNNGLLNSSSGLVIFNHSVAGNVDGNGVYQLFNLDRVGGGLTNVDANLVVNNDFSLD